MVREASFRRRLLLVVSTMLLFAALGHTPAKAADLGGDCCADLEERVAELEATTVRKGNKKVTVTLYGQEITPSCSGMMASRRMPTPSTTTTNPRASASKARPRSAGIGRRDIDLRSRPREPTPCGSISSTTTTRPIRSATLNVRWSHIYINNKKLGEVRLGLTATPIYNITKDTNVTELEDTMHSDNRMMQGFFLRAKDSPANAEGLSKVKWQDISRCYNSSNAFVCSTRKNGAAYWSPNWEGFSASVGWFEDDEWGAALRYKKEWGEAFEVGAGIGYADIRDERLQTRGRRSCGLSARFSGLGGLGIHQAQADRPVCVHCLELLRHGRLQCHRRL